MLLRLVCFLLCFSSLPQPALADDQQLASAQIAAARPSDYSLAGRPLDFLQSKGPHSLVGLFGVPSPVPSILTKNHLTVSLAHSNMFAAGAGTDTAVLFDGERSRLALGWTQVRSSCLRTHLELPVVAHAEGYFDETIEAWHEFFNLPNANRGETPANVLAVAYRDPSGEMLRLDQPVAEHGDITVSVLWSMQCMGADRTGREKPLLRFGLKLPTGRLAALTGSGKTDAFMDVTSTTRHWGNWSGRASAGIFLPGRSEAFSVQEKVAAFGTLALGWNGTPKLKPIIQVEWHTALFDTSMRELGQFSALATAGFRWRHSKNLTSEFGVLEDIVPDAAPDIGLHFGLRYRY